MGAAETEDVTQKLVRQVQSLVRRTPTVLVGSGFSCAHGLPNMAELGRHLVCHMYDKLVSQEAKNLWEQNIHAVTDNLELGLNEIAIGANGRDEIIGFLRELTSELVDARMAEAEIRILENPNPELHAPARLFKRLFAGAPENGHGISIVSTNYDTLVELFCDLASLPIETGFEGFSHRRLRSGSLFRSIYTLASSSRPVGPTKYRLEKKVRVIKPHGSVTWLATEFGPMEVLSRKARGKAAIVVPGPSKYEDALTDNLFDKMRTAMNVAFTSTEALLTIGFGFNDRHLQGIIESRLKESMPLIILTKDLTEATTSLINRFPHILAFCEDEKGSRCRFEGCTHVFSEPLWQLEDFIKYFLE